jgi:hypothetical protein
MSNYVIPNFVLNTHEGIPVGRCAYVGISRDETRTFENNGRSFRIALYGAFHAGIIGPEFNGIVILDVDNRLVVLDQHKRESTGYFGPTVDQWAEFDRIMGLNWADFLRFIDGHPRSRASVLWIVKDKDGSLRYDR